METTTFPKADANELMKTASALCALGEKLAGSDEEAKAVDTICARLRGYGFEPVVEEYDNYIGYPTRTEVRMGGAEGEPLEAVGVAFGGVTPPEGSTFELQDVGHGKATDYATADVSGKAVLVRGIPTFGLVSAALKRGAAAVVCVTDGPQRHKMTLSPVWGSPATDAELARMPRLPVATVNKPDGERLAAGIASAEAGEARVHIVAEHFEGWRRVRLPVLDIPGTEPEFVLLGSHYCTWFDGSTDNITANALLVEVARLMRARSAPRRYGLRLAWWPGHTHGRYSGSAVYADAHWRELRDRAILYFNVDSVGARDASLCLARNQMAEISDFSAAMLDELVGPLSRRDLERTKRQWKRPERSGDMTRPSRSSDQSFWGVGLTSLQIVSMLPDGHPDRSPTINGSGGAWWWHTDQETLDKIGPDILARDSDVHFRIIDAITTGKLLPLDVRVMARDIKGVLEEYDEAAAGRVDLQALWAASRDFEAAADEMAAYGANAGADARDALSYDRALLAVTRMINPVVYQAGSAFAQDPATKTRLLPGLAGLLDLAPAGSDALKMQIIGLRRQVNRTVDALTQATRRIRQEISRTGSAQQRGYSA